MEEVTVIYIISIAILIVLSAIFSCSETSITAVSRAKIHRLKNEGDKKAIKLSVLLKQREKVVSAMLLGNNAVNILASALATSLFIENFGQAGLFYATIVMTTLVIIFAEITPKTFAIKAPEKMLQIFFPIIQIIIKTFFPLTNFLQKNVNRFVALFFGKKGKGSSEELEEIRDTVNLKAKEGSIFKYDKDLLDGVLDLSDTEISEIMVHRKDIETIDANLEMTEIIKQALGSNYTRIPLWKDDKENIVSILNIRKLLKELHFRKDKRGDLKEDNLRDFDLSKVISEAWFVPATNTLKAQLVEFRKKKKRFALVIDEYGSIQGLLTLEDIMEEIVGEIKEQDEEFDIKIIKLKSGAYKIAGKTLIRDINKQIDWEIEEDDHAYSIAAFVINKLGRIPEEKENFVIDDYYFEVLKRRSHDIILMKVKQVNKN